MYGLKYGVLIYLTQEWILWKEDLSFVCFSPKEVWLLKPAPPFSKILEMENFPKRKTLQTEYKSEK